MLVFSSIFLALHIATCQALPYPDHLLTLVLRNGLARAAAVVETASVGGLAIADAIRQQLQGEKKNVMNYGINKRSPEVFEPIPANPAPTPSVFYRDVVKNAWWDPRPFTTSQHKITRSPTTSQVGAQTSSTSSTPSATALASSSSMPKPPEGPDTHINGAGGIAAAAVMGTFGFFSILFLSYLLYVKYRNRRVPAPPTKDREPRFSFSSNASDGERSLLVREPQAQPPDDVPTVLQASNRLRQPLLSNPVTQADMIEGPRGCFTERGEADTRAKANGSASPQGLRRSPWPRRRSYAPSPLTATTIAPVSDGTTSMIRKSLSATPSPFVIDHPMVQGRDMAQISPGLSPAYPYPLSPGHVGERSISAAVNKPLPVYQHERTRSLHM